MAFIQAKIFGVHRLAQSIQERLQQSKRQDDGSFAVGYSAPYAIFVHENLEASHPVGQAKFLEQPARQMKEQLASTVVVSAKNGIGLKAATEEAAIQLFEASQELVPVATGALKASGFVRDEQDNTIAGSDLKPEEVLALRQAKHQQQEQARKQPAKPPTHE